MKLPDRGRFEYNFNTFILLGGIVMGIVSTGATWGYFASQLASNDKETRDWQIRHEQLHRDRLQETSERQARTDQRLSQLEKETRVIEQLGYRVTVAEQAGINTAQSIQRLTETVNTQSTDIRVMREIIERQFGSTVPRLGRRSGLNP